MCALAGIAALIVFGKGSAWSLLVGATIFIIPNAYFIHYAFRYDGARWMPWVKQSFVTGALGKFSLTALGFALTFVFFTNIQPIALFCGFVLMLVWQWPLAYVISERRRRV